jgi:hypothetical protein
MKKQLCRNIVAVFAVLAIIVQTGCRKQLDINQNPNNPTLEQGDPRLVFPAAVLATAGKEGGDLAILGAIWGEYLTQSAISNQYKFIDAYDVKNTDFNASYNVLFTNGLKNYQYVIDKSSAAGDWNFYLMATVMKAYTTELLVDLYDKIPYFEALQGSANLQPKFDDGYTIYQDLLKRIDTALGKDFSLSTNSVPGTADLVFGGNMDNWKRFANTLQLKMYLRMVNAHPNEAQAGVQALYARGAQFLTTDAGVSNFTNAPGLDNPLYEQNIRQLNTPDNLRASRTFASWLQANNDPRITTYFGSTTAGSINQGDYNNTTDPNYPRAAVFVQKPTDPVIFLSLPESYFLQAEADLRYFGGLRAQSLYNQGVIAAFNEAGQANGANFVAPTGAYAYPVAGTFDQKLEAIIVQKWASFPHGVEFIEGYFEKQRTGYPRTSTVYSTDPSYVPGRLVVSRNSVLPAGQLPRRLVYPYSETSRNTNAPEVVPITTPVWFAK